MSGSNPARRLGTSDLVRLTTAALLLGTLASPPYGYYTMLRWVVFGIAGFSAYEAVSVRRVGWAWTCVIVGMVFNPFMPVHLERVIWLWADFICAALLIAACLGLRRADTLAS
jgi:hypothetical protein